jgi:hypothetical protein
MNTKSPIFILLITLLLTSCNVLHCPTKEAFLRSYGEFVTTVEIKRDNDNKDWTNVENDFKDYADRCYSEFKSDFTSEDKAQFWTNTIKYYLARFDGDINKAYNDAKSRHSDDFVDDLQDFLSSGNADVISMFKNLFKDDINKGVDDALDALQNLGENIKEALEEK